MAKTVRAAVLVKPKTIELRELPRPAIGADDALLRIEACGICGSDYEQYDGVAPHTPDYQQYPVVPGHEPLGVIEEIGAEREEALGRGRGRSRGGALGLRLRAVRGVRAVGARACRTRGAPTATPTSGSRRSSGAATPSTCISARCSVVKKMDARIPAGVAVMFDPLAAGLSWAATIPADG